MLLANLFIYFFIFTVMFGLLYLFIDYTFWGRRRRKQLEKRFENQLDTLRDRGCPKEIVRALAKKKNGVITWVMEKKIIDGHIPFIPVVSLEIGSEDLMRMVRYHDQVGEVQNRPSKDEVLLKPYFLLDVEDGTAMLGRSATKAELLIKRQGRSCLTTAEGIALCIHIDVLKRHNVDFAGSQREFMDEYVISSIYISGETPTLNINSVNTENNDWGSASCRSRL